MYSLDNLSNRESSWLDRCCEFSRKLGFNNCSKGGVFESRNSGVEKSGLEEERERGVLEGERKQVICEGGKGFARRRDWRVRR